MTRLLLAAVAASAVFMAAPASADPFDAAKRNCEAIGVDTYCMQVSLTQPITLGGLLEIYRKRLGVNFTVEQTIIDNGWNGQVDGETILDPSREYVFIAS